MFSSLEQLNESLRAAGYIADSVGVRYLAWLMRRFHGDFRLVAAAYYAGENIVDRRGLAYRNPDVVAYVSRIRTTYLRQVATESKFAKPQ